MCPYLLFYWSSRQWKYVKEEQSEPVFVNLLRRPWIDSQPGGIDPRNRFLGSITVYEYGQWLFASAAGGVCHQRVIWLAVAEHGCHQGAIWLAVPVGESQGSDLIGCLFCSGTRRCASPRTGGRRSPELCNLYLLNVSLNKSNIM